MVDLYQLKVKSRRNSFPHLESHHRGLLEALYTFLNVNGGKGIGKFNQVLREREKALLKIPFILRLFATYSILLLPSTRNMIKIITQQLCLRAELSQLCPAWFYCCVKSSCLAYLDQPDGSCVGLFRSYNLFFYSRIKVSSISNMEDLL